LSEVEYDVMVGMRRNERAGRETTAFMSVRRVL